MRYRVVRRGRKVCDYATMRGAATFVASKIGEVDMSYAVQEEVLKIGPFRWFRLSERGQKMAIDMALDAFLRGRPII